MKSKYYSHFLWQPFADFDFHLFIFDYNKVVDSLIWSRVFGIKKPRSKPISRYGSVYFNNTHGSTKLALSLMKHSDGSIDITNIVHEVTHACDEYFQVCEMTFGSEYGSSEFRSYLSGSLVSKICQICNKLNIQITYSKFDSMKLSNILKLV